jgi:hypothetical protein
MRTASITCTTPFDAGTFAEVTFAVAPAFVVTEMAPLFDTLTVSWSPLIIVIGVIDGTARLVERMADVI